MASMLFEQLCNTLEELFLKKRNRQEQDRLLFEFLNEVKLKIKTDGKKDDTVFPILRLFLPDLERERSAYNLKETKLGLLLVKVLSLPKTCHDAQKLLNFRSIKNSQEGTDFASVAYYVLNNRVGTKTCKLTVGDINDNLDKISAAEIGNKGPILDETFTTVFKNTTAKQAKWFLRIVLKDLKLAIGKTRILSALHPDAPEYYERCSSLLKVCEEFDDGSSRPLELGIELFSAVCPMLSERQDITRLSLKQDKQYHIEEKFDGERFQVHMKDGVFEYFSRKGFKYSANYGKTYESGLLTPHLRDCFKPGVNSFILDGEMMGWHKQYERYGSKGMSFDVKKITENSKYRPCLCAFDLLYYNGSSLVGPLDKGGMPLNERLKILDGMFTDKPGVIQHSRREVVSDKLKVLRALNKAIENEEEGIVLKESDSLYIANKRNAGWYKIKPEYTEGTMDDLDLVVIGADYAENKTQGLAKSFVVACVDRNAPEGERWLAIGRAATGLSFEERERVCASLEPHWKLSRQVPVPNCLFFNKEKPDLWVMPQHSVVFTVRATELIRSTDFGTDYTLRFPRIIKIRDDKPVDDVMTLDEFNKLVANKGPVVKMSTKHISQDDIEVPKTRRKRTAKVLQVAQQFLSKAEEVEAKSQALTGRKICVLSGDEDCNKTELEKLVLSHGGVVVQNISSTTWLGVYGRANMRGQNAIKSQVCDVASTTWLRALPPSPLPCPPPTPLDLIAVTPATRLKLARDYDKYGDSYKEQIDVDTLKMIFAKMDRDNEPPIHITTQEMMELDQDLFGESNPHAFLRRCFIHFQDEKSLTALKAKFFGAKLCEVNSPNLTHVVITTEMKEDNVEEIKRKVHPVPVLSEHWLNVCFAESRLVSETGYELSLNALL